MWCCSKQRTDKCWPKIVSGFRIFEQKCGANLHKQRSFASIRPIGAKFCPRRLYLGKFRLNRAYLGEISPKKFLFRRNFASIRPIWAKFRPRTPYLREIRLFLRIRSAISLKKSKTGGDFSTNSCLNVFWMASYSY